MKKQGHSTPSWAIFIGTALLFFLGCGLPSAHADEQELSQETAALADWNYLTGYFQMLDVYDLEDWFRELQEQYLWIVIPIYGRIYHSAKSLQKR